MKTIKDATTFDELLDIKYGKLGTTERDEFETKSNVKKLIDVSKEIVDSYSEKPGFVCLTCIEEISNNEEVQINSAPIEIDNKSAIFFLIKSPETELNWKFAVEQ